MCVIVGSLGLIYVKLLLSGCGFILHTNAFGDPPDESFHQLLYYSGHKKGMVANPALT